MHLSKEAISNPLCFTTSPEEPMCNQEKAEMHWYEYELYMLTNYSDLYFGVRAMRPTDLLQALKD